MKIFSYYHGQCDERCYNGHGVCRCACNGMNHGVGVLQAIANAMDLARVNPMVRVSRKARQEAWRVGKARHKIAQIVVARTKDRTQVPTKKAA